MNERGPDPKKNTFYGRPAGAVFLPAIVAVLLSLAFFRAGKHASGQQSEICLDHYGC